MKTQYGGHKDIELKETITGKVSVWQAKSIVTVGTKSYVLGYFPGDAGSSWTNPATSYIEYDIVKSALHVQNYVLPRSPFNGIPDGLNNISNEYTLNREVHNTVSRIKSSEPVTIARSLKQKDKSYKGTTFVLTFINDSTKTPIQSISINDLRNYRTYLHNVVVLKQSLEFEEKYTNAKTFTDALCDLIKYKNDLYNHYNITSAIVDNEPPKPPKPPIKFFSFFSRKPEPEPDQDQPSIYIYSRPTVQTMQTIQQGGAYKKTEEKVVINPSMTRVVYKGPRGAKYVRINREYIKLSDAKKKHASRKKPK